ncbi:rab GTPase-binding effector protein 1-like isoform X1 [Homalodisca vitripennis]|uniref:rab GTPase-binding effector protein 1-like isoform X1 n=1 Tax=Homalodisca vitripennis TaxID=197043 RepID=UPI001EEA80D2|nr:rab GTPase-binding effector protein 1-like isoform X1 [Homalodisca vitripennis]
MESPENESTHPSKDSVADDNDVFLKLQQLTDRAAQHETEKQQMREEFGLQRAKMKELYLQKEEEIKRGSSEQTRLTGELKRLQSELDEARVQATLARLDLEEEKRKFQDEVASLQQLVTETVEESSRYESELKDLRRTNERLEAEVTELRGQSHEAPLLAAPGAMISTLARRVASQLGADSAAPAPPPAPVIATADNLEESMRKVNKYAKEDAEVLRSLVIPLEEEINALKEKLRANDLLLRKYQEEGSHAESLDTTSSILESPAVDTASISGQENIKGNNLTSSLSKVPSSPLRNSVEGKLFDTSPESGKATECDMCLNYETQLVNEQKRVAELTKQLGLLERCRDDLQKEMANRKDMEQKWNENKEEHKAQVSELLQRVTSSEAALKELRANFGQMTTSLTRELDRLRAQREQSQRDLDSIQLENEKLVGRYNAHSQELQDAFIDLPDKVEELQEMVLKCREDLIAARVGQERAEAVAATQREEAQLYLSQSEAEQQQRQQLENSLAAEINVLKTQLNKEEMLRKEKQKRIQIMEQAEVNMRSEMDDLRSQLDNVKHARKILEDDVNELRSRVTSLQTELDNGETVQKDFVLLSQSLQQELERIRSADTQVRWEHLEDVDECHGCRSPFTTNRQKNHCRHCIRVFCVNCLSHTVASGPNHRPSKVCDVCHTLLDRDTAPYFSTDPPHSND